MTVQNAQPVLEKIETARARLGASALKQVDGDGFFSDQSQARAALADARQALTEAEDLFRDQARAYRAAVENEDGGAA